MHQNWFTHPYAYLLQPFSVMYLYLAQGWYGGIHSQLFEAGGVNRSSFVPLRQQLENCSLIRKGLTRCGSRTHYLNLTQIVEGTYETRPSCQWEMWDSIFVSYFQCCHLCNPHETSMKWKQAIWHQPRAELSIPLEWYRHVVTAAIVFNSRRYIICRWEREASRENAFWY